VPEEVGEVAYCCTENRAVTMLQLCGVSSSHFYISAPLCGFLAEVTEVITDYAQRFISKPQQTWVLFPFGLLSLLTGSLQQEEVPVLSKNRATTLKKPAH